MARRSIILLFFALLPAAPESAPTLKEAQAELYAARYQNAADLYSKLIEQHAGGSEAHYGLVRALLAAHRSQDAYAAAERAVLDAPETAEVQSAAGLAAYRQGDLLKAEEYFRKAMKLNPDYPGALRGVAAIASVVSRFKTAHDLRLLAYRQAPDDPDLMLAYANTLKGKEHVEQLEKVLAAYDPSSEQARRMRAHIAYDRAVGDRKLTRLVSPYEKSRIKLYQVRSSASLVRGVSLRVQLNQKQTLHLLLDTGASGIAISPKAAEKAALQILGDESSEVKGIGDGKASAYYQYLVAELRIGDVVFADYPVSVFHAAQSADYDGLIGADVFAKFLIGIDFPNLELTLDPRQAAEPSQEPRDAGEAAPGFHRIYRFGNHLAVPTLVNGKVTKLFLIDSGAFTNLIDTAVAQESGSVYSDPRTVVKGIQGKVAQTSRANRASLVFAGFRQENSDLIAIHLDKMSESLGAGFGGILGIPALSLLKVNIDYADGTIKLEYRR